MGLRAAGHYCCKRGEVKIPNSVSSVLVLWCVMGQVRAYIDDESYLIRPRQGLIVMTDVKCKIKAMRNLTEFCWCSLDGSESDEIVDKLGLGTGSFDWSEEPVDMILDWIEKLPSQSERLERELAAAAYEALYNIAKNVSDDSVEPVFAEIKKYIENNLSSHSLTIDNIAENFGIHRSTLSTMFRRNMELSTKDYITEMRLKKAEHLLTSTKNKISEIAAMCGFNDPNYFSRLFRKERGMTPREYRDALTVK